jgi:phosphorylated CTD-interacting factor 1
MNEIGPVTTPPMTPTKPVPADLGHNASAAGPSYGEELHPELVNQGWRKFWSKRENRPYYWNKVTGESLWETPVLNRSQQFDPDPLGICNAG